jgi:hypothetical protein
MDITTKQTWIKRKIHHIYKQDSGMFRKCQDSVLRKAVLPSFLTVHNSLSANFFTMQILQCCLHTVSLRLGENSIFKSHTIFICYIMCIRIIFNRMAIPIYCPYAWTCWVDFDKTLYQSRKCKNSTLDWLHM